MRIHPLDRVVLLAAIAFSVISASPALAQDGTWTSLGPSGTPGLLRGHSNVFDRDQQRFVIFAGGSGTVPKPWDLMNDVWILDVSGAPTWSLVPHQSVEPGGRLDAQYGYDAARNRLLIFGGYGRHYPTTPFEYLNDVWELSLDGTPHWTEIFPAGPAPAGRLAGAAVYDPMRPALHRLRRHTGIAGGHVVAQPARQHQLAERAHERSPTERRLRHDVRLRRLAGPHAHLRRVDERRLLRRYERRLGAEAARQSDVEPRPNDGCATPRETARAARSSIRFGTAW
jgi:hypothetical protein